MGLKNFKKQNRPAPAETNPEWLAQEARIKEMNIGLERKIWINRRKYAKQPYAPDIMPTTV